MTAFASQQQLPWVCPRLRVDGEGTVLWRNAAANRVMADGCGLVIRAGKLRARDAKVAKLLRTAIRWAADQPGGFETRREAPPLIFERPYEGGAEIWWVAADADIVQIIGNSGLVAEERLVAAAVVYGLSPAQARLAKAILAGNALTEAAAAAGITANTARTHLRRMFDKTGVRTQTALVRSLMAVVPPP